MEENLRYSTETIQWRCDGITRTPVRFLLTFHDLDQDTFDRILDAVNKKVSYPIKVVLK